MYDNDLQDSKTRVVPTMVPSELHQQLCEALDNPALERVVAAWDSLPEPIRVAIVAMIEATRSDSAAPSAGTQM